VMSNVMPLKPTPPLRKITHAHTTVARYLIVAALISIVGCNQPSGAPRSTEPRVIAEGTIYSLEYKLVDGRTGGFTRLNVPKAVPGGNGR